MILDKENRFADSQALTATALLENVIDLNIARDIFKGEPMVVVLFVEVAADFTDTNETYAFAVETDSVAAMSSATILVTRTITAALLAINTAHTLPVPFEINLEQFIGVRATLGGTTPSVTLSAYLLPQSFVDKDKLHASGFLITG